MHQDVGWRCMLARCSERREYLISTSAHHNGTNAAKSSGSGRFRHRERYRMPLIVDLAEIKSPDSCFFTPMMDIFFPFSCRILCQMTGRIRKKTSEYSFFSAYCTHSQTLAHLNKHKNVLQAKAHTRAAQSRYVASWAVAPNATVYSQK